MAAEEPLMDPSERSRFLSTLRSVDDFRADVRRDLQIEDLLQLPQTVGTLVDFSARHQRDIAGLASSIRDYMNQTLVAVRDVSREVATLRVDMDERTTRLEDGVTRLEEGVSRLEEGVTRLEERVTRLEERLTALEVSFIAKFDQIESELRDIRGGPE